MKRKHVNRIIAWGAMAAGAVVLWQKIKPYYYIFAGKKMPKKRRDRPLGM